MMLPHFSGTPDLVRPQVLELLKVGVVRVWFRMKAWSDRLETKIKLNAFLRFISKEKGYRGRKSKEMPEIKDFKDFTF